MTGDLTNAREELAGLRTDLSRGFLTDSGVIIARLERLAETLRVQLQNPVSLADLSSFRQELRELDPFFTQAGTFLTTWRENLSSLGAVGAAYDRDALIGEAARRGRVLAEV